MRRSFIAIFLVALGIGMAILRPIHASPINVDTGTSVSLSPGSTSTFTVSLTNENAGTAITTFNGWGLILQVIPRAGATGTASFSALASPASNGALADPGEASFDGAYTLNSAVNGTVAAYLTSIGNDTPVSTTFALGQTYNIGYFTVLLSGDATPGSIWDVYALNDEFDTSSWSTPGGVATAFGNLATPLTGQYASVQIGTISAVPEPSSFMLTASALVGAGWYGWRSRRNPLVVAA